MSTSRLHTLLGIGAIAGPLLAFAGARLTGRLPGPASARAGTAQKDDARFTPLARNPLTPRQHETLRVQPDFNSNQVLYPFYLSAAPTGEPEPEAQPETEPTPEFAVSSFMGGRSPIVIIDSRPRRVGDDLGNGWVLTSINPAARSFTVTKGDRTETITAE